MNAISEEKKRAIQTLHAQIVSHLRDRTTNMTKRTQIDDRTAYELDYLLWEDAARCFPREGFQWDGAFFRWDFCTGKLFVELNTYPNQFGAYRDERITLTAPELHTIAKEHHLRQELLFFESESDWAMLFDDELKSAVSELCSMLEKRQEEREAEERQKNAISIPKKYAKRSPDMGIIKVILELEQQYSTSRIQLTQENGRYHIDYSRRTPNHYTNPAGQSEFSREATQPEAVWIEKRIYDALKNRDKTTWESLPGGDRMNVVITLASKQGVELNLVKPVRKYSDLLHDLQTLVQYGSREEGDAGMNAVSEEKEQAIRALRNQIISHLRQRMTKQAPYDDRISYELDKLLWDAAAKRFPNGVVKWDCACFRLELKTGELFAELSTYPNQFGAYREERMILTAPELYTIVKEHHLRQELLFFESETDWAMLFDDELKATVSELCSTLEKQKEELEDKERSEHAILIPKKYAKRSPSMRITNVYLELEQFHSTSRIRLTKENGRYHIDYSCLTNNGFANPLGRIEFSREITPPEAVWLEKRIDDAIKNRDKTTWESIAGGDKMNVIIRFSLRLGVKLYLVKPVRKYSDLLNDLADLAQYGSRS